MKTDSSMQTDMLFYLEESAPILVLQLDAQQKLVSANAHAHRVLNSCQGDRSLRDLVVDFTPVPDLTTPDATRKDGHLVTLNTSSGLPESYRLRFFPNSGGWLAMGSIDFDEQMRLRAEVLGLNRELNDLTRELHLANAELRELNQLKNRFLGMAAHDLRRPISLIMTYSEFVLDEAAAQLSEEHQTFLHRCVGAATDMKRLIDNFLDVSIIESGALQLDLAPTRATAIISATEPIARLLADKKGVSLLVDTQDPGHMTLLDAPKLQQVLLNLIGNAVEHSASGQRVWLSSRYEEQQLLIAVRDEGHGIAFEDQARLFTAFTRAGTRKTAGERSVGLGLSIARLVVEAHGGSIWVDSAPGQGATFQVALPVAKENQIEKVKQA